MDAGLLGGFFGRVLILAPFGGTVGAIAFVVAAFILRRLEAGGYPVEGGKAGAAAERPLPLLAVLSGWLGSMGFLLGAVSLAAGALSMLVLAVMMLLSALA